MPEPDWTALEAAWVPARRSGVLGSATIEELVEHAAGYLPAACRVEDEFLGIDLGTGAGVPGLLLAMARPASHWLLVDASTRRCELAERAVKSLGLNDRVTVHHIRAEDLAHDPRWRRHAQLVVARSFGPLPETMECGLPLLADDGHLVVSVAREGAGLGVTAIGIALPFVSAELRDHGTGCYLSARVIAEVPTNLPRRAAARRRNPLF